MCTGQQAEQARTATRKLLARRAVYVGVTGLALIALTGALPAASQSLRTLTALLIPSVTNDSIWMGMTQGYFKEQGLEIDVRTFPSGTTALQSFRAGAGDISLAGDLPGVSYWQNSGKQYKVFTVLHREAEIYSATVRKEIKTAADLKGKTIGTRVGSTGSWFISEYLEKHGIPESEVTVRDLDAQVLPAALCRGDIDGIFIWYPAGERAKQICPDKVHTLAKGNGYINGYAVLGVRPEWVQKPENAKALEGFVRAMAKGRDYAKKNYPAVFAYVKEKFGFTDELARYGWETVGREFAFDEVFYKDYCGLSRWMQKRGMLKEPLNFDEFLYTDALKAVDPNMVALPSNKCPGA